MGTSYSLFRVRRPIASPNDDLEALAAGLHFGLLADLKERLFSTRIFGVDIHSRAESPGQVRCSWRGEVSGKPFENLQIEADDGRHIDLTLCGDPVEHLDIDRSIPRDFFPIIDALPDLGPFALVCDTDGIPIDPEGERPRPPWPSTQSPVLQVRGPPQGSPLSREHLEWILEVPQGLTSLAAPVLLGDRLAVMTERAVALLDAGSGGVLWSCDWTCAPLACASAGAVVIAGNHPEAFGLSLGDGRVLWRRPIKGRVTAPPVPAPGGTVAFGTEGGCVYGLDPQSGAVRWWVDWLKGPVYTRLAVTDRWIFLTATEGFEGVLLRGDCREARWERVHRFQPRSNGPCLLIPGMLELAAATGRVFVLLHHAVVTLAPPDHASPTTLLEYQWDTGFERFITDLGEDRVAFAVSTGAHRGMIRAIDAVSLETAWELALEHTPSQLVMVDEKRCACLLRPFRGDPEAEGKILLLETRTGKVVREISLGFRGWQDAFVAGSNGRLFASLRLAPPGEPCWGKHGSSYLACWQLA